MLGYLRSQRVDDAEDVLGEVFLQVARDLPRFKGDDDAVRSWVFTIAHHRMVDQHRRRQRRPPMAQGDVPEQPAPEEPDRLGLDPQLQSALDGLTAEQREVVLLRFVADLPLEEVARITRRTVGAVKALQHRALANLAQAVSREA